MTRAYLFCVWLLLFSSGFVRIEPAPYDLILILLFGAGLVTSLLLFRQYLVVPLALLLVFTLSNLVSMLFAIELEKGMKYFIISSYLIVSWVFFVGLYGRFGKRGLEVVWSGYICAASLSAGVAVLIALGFFTNVHLFVWEGYRAVGLFKDPNVFGAFLVPPAVYAIMRSDQGKWAYKMLWLLIFLVLSFGVLLSLSRGAWGNYIVALVTFFLISFANGNKTGIRVVFKIALIVAVALIFVVNQSELGALLAGRLSLQPYDEDRFFTHALALQTGLSTPLGIGPGQSEILFQYATHNLYLRILSEYGWSGFFAFMSFLLITVYRALRGAMATTFPQRYESVLVMSVLAGALFNSLFIDSLHWRHLWLLLALPWVSQWVAPTRVERREHEDTLPHHPR